MTFRPKKVQLRQVKMNFARDWVVLDNAIKYQWYYMQQHGNLFTNQFNMILIIDTPYLVLMGKLLSICCENLKLKWPWDMSISQYSSQTDLSTSSWGAISNHYWCMAPWGVVSLRGNLSDLWHRERRYGHRVDGLDWNFGFKSGGCVKRICRFC